MSTVIIELPERIRETLQAQRQELPRFALEALAVEGYRQELLSRGEVGELLGMNFGETEAFLKEHKAYLHYDMQDFQQDMLALESLRQKQA